MAASPNILNAPGSLETYTQAAASPNETPARPLSNGLQGNGLMAWNAWKPDTTNALTASPAKITASSYRPICIKRRSEEHTSELQSRENLVCRLLLEKKKEQPK